VFFIFKIFCRRTFTTSCTLFNQNQKSNLEEDDSKPTKKKNWHNQGVLSIEEIYKQIQQDNAQDIVVMKLNNSSDYVKYFVVCTAYSTRHLKHMALSLNSFYKRSKGLEDRFTIIEGKRESNDWNSLFLGNSVVHFMLEEVRSKFELEKLWLLGSEFDDHVKLARNYEDDFDFNDEDIELMDASLSDAQFLEGLNGFEDLLDSEKEDSEKEEVDEEDEKDDLDEVIEYMV